MRQHLINDGSFTEAEAMRLMRSLVMQPAVKMAGYPVRQAVISRTVEDEVIPRLVRALDSVRPAALPHAEQALMTSEVATLTDVLLSGTQPQATEFVEQMQGNGLSGESLLLNLLTPAARRLGTMWETDDCSFADVTIGLLRLSKVMRVVARAFDAELAPVQNGPRALLVQAPGEQHSFGIAMVACFFRRAGWNVLSDPLPDSTALIDLVKHHWFSLVGLSLSSTDRLENLAADIRAIRAASRNPALCVLVGGFVFLEQPQLAGLVGADGTACDARRAVQQASALVSQLACAQ